MTKEHEITTTEGTELNAIEEYSWLSPEEVFVLSNVNYYHGAPEGKDLTENQRKYFAEALTNAINVSNYFMGEYSYCWELNGIGKTEAEVYGYVQGGAYPSEIDTFEHYLFIEYIITTPIICNDEDSEYFQKECYAIILLSMDRYGNLSPRANLDSVHATLDDARAEFAANFLPVFMYIYRGTIAINVPQVYLPDIPDQFSRIDEIVEAIYETGISQFSLYTGLQSSFNEHRLGDNNEVCITEFIEFCVVIDEKKYLGEYLCYSQYSNLDNYLRVDDVYEPYREPNNDMERFLLDQIVKLGNIYETSG
jgi:hypothetical protein